MEVVVLADWPFWCWYVGYFGGLCGVEEEGRKRNTEREIKEIMKRQGDVADGGITN